MRIQTGATYTYSDGSSTRDKTAVARADCFLCCLDVHPHIIKLLLREPFVVVEEALSMPLRLFPPVLLGRLDLAHQAYGALSNNRERDGRELEAKLVEERVCVCRLSLLRSLAARCVTESVRNIHLL